MRQSLTRIPVFRLTVQGRREVNMGQSSDRGSVFGQNAVHPAWQAFIRYCEQLGHGEIEKLKIQDGIPVLAEVTTQKVKFG